MRRSTVHYRTIGLWLLVCHFFRYRTIGISNIILDNSDNGLYRISDQGLNLSDYRISDSEKTSVCPPLISTFTILRYGCSHTFSMLRIHVCVESLYCKRPILCLASSKILTPPPPTPSLPGECVGTPPPPRLWYGGRTHSLVGEEGGGQYFGRRQTQLCTLHM
jgi:hypothetical protein